MNWKLTEENFEVLERVGNGGYGSVYKVRNRLDDKIYAVKKIRLDCLDLQELDEEAQKVLKECRTLSLLDHPNILRYYSSWLVRAKYRYQGGEISSPTSKNNITTKVSFIFKPRHNKENEGASGLLGLKKDIKHLIDNENDRDDNMMTEIGMNYQESPIYNRRIQEDEESLSNDSFSTPATLLIDKEDDVLYIQTEFCDLNLEQYLEERGALLNKCHKLESQGIKLLRHDLEVHSLLLYEAFSIGLQLIQALKYIHCKQKLIHRDLKPSNIFLNLTSRPEVTKRADSLLNLVILGWSRSLRMCYRLLR